MDKFLIVILITWLIAIGLYIKERRSFSVGIIFAIGLAEIGIFFLITLINSNNNIATVVLLAIYASIVILALGIPIYLIFNGKVMKHKEGRRLALFLHISDGKYKTKSRLYYCSWVWAYRR